MCDILANGSLKQHTFLGDIANPCCQLTTGKLADICTIQQHTSFSRLVEPLKNFQQCGFATPVPADNRGQATGFYTQTNTIDDRVLPLRVIAENNIFEDKFACRAFVRNWRFLQFFFFMKQLSEPLTSLLELGKGPPAADKLVQRTEQPASQHVCRDQ